MGFAREDASIDLDDTTVGYEIDLDAAGYQSNVCGGSAQERVDCPLDCLMMIL
jgi:hypothetical protein